MKWERASKTRGQGKGGQGKESRAGGYLCFREEAPDIFNLVVIPSHDGVSSHSGPVTGLVVVHRLPAAIQAQQLVLILLIRGIFWSEGRTTSCISTKIHKYTHKNPAWGSIVMDLFLLKAGETSCTLLFAMAINLQGWRLHRLLQTDRAQWQCYSYLYNVAPTVTFEFKSSRFSFSKEESQRRNGAHLNHVF